MRCCGKCKKPLKTIESIISENETEKIVSVTEHCEDCKIFYGTYNKKVIKPKKAKKDSVLSIWAAILAFFTCTCFIGGILGIIDLCINDKTKRHLGSWFALVFCAIYLIIGGGTILGSSGSSANDTASNNTQTSEIIVTTTPSETVVETPASEEISEVVPEVGSVEVPTETEEEYKASCQEYNYKDVLRNPNDYVGQRIVIEMEISSVHSEDILTPVKYYFGYTKDEPDDTYYYGDFYAVFDKRYDTSLKLLDEDVIIVWGEISEPQETQSFIVNSEEVFCIDMKYAELIAE